MSPRIKVSDLVIQRLEKLEDGSSGFLFGSSDENSTYVLGLIKHEEKKPADGTNYSEECEMIHSLPANINFCGVFDVIREKKTGHINSQLCEKINCSLVLEIDSASKNVTAFLYEGGELKKTDHEICTGKDWLKSFLYLRLTATVLLSCDFQIESVKEAFSNIQDKVADANAAFHFLGTDLYILGYKSDDVIGISPESTLEKVLSEVKESGKIVTKNDFNLLNVSLYIKGTNNDASPQLAPLIKYVKKAYKHVEIHLGVDSLAYVHSKLKVKDLYYILVESVHRNLKLNEKSLLSQLESNGVHNVLQPKTYHFYPSSCRHFLSIVYPEKQTPEQLKEFRENIHKLLALPLNSPLFRQANSVDLEKEEDTESLKKYILNPHEGLPVSGVPEGEVSLVQGTYAYHHYMQENFDDNGWGCAYRSLQTIFSWFRFQGYTTLSVPTHKEIQQCLVDIGDKPASFVGSKQWIGSTEVSFVLDSILGVTCRIVSVSSGEEMTMKGGELSYHFRTQGTPVMIGGGVLAHTILGVDYNKKTGAIKFLILDPHYTGSEDLKIIQSKGWCGWKGPEFWKKDAFYNMCLPLRPKCV